MAYDSGADGAAVLPFEGRSERKLRRATLLLRIAEQLGREAPKGTIGELERLVGELRAPWAKESGK
jgi:hypothetical protein